MALRDIQKPRRIVKLYHGTYARGITKFDISKSRKSFLDFGRGIYFTTNEQQAMIWSVRHSREGVVYEIELDTSLINIKQYFTYSDKFIETFCFCRAGLESNVLDIKGYDAVYGYVIDNDKETIVKRVNDYTLGNASASEIRGSIKVFDNKDQLCIKNQNILNKIVIKRCMETEVVSGYPRGSERAVRWKKRKR